MKLSSLGDKAEKYVAPKFASMGNGSEIPVNIDDGSNRPDMHSVLQSVNAGQLGQDIANIFNPKSASSFLGSLGDIALTVAKFFI